MEDMRMVEEMQKQQNQLQKLQIQIKTFNLTTASSIVHKFMIEKILKLGLSQLKKNMINLKNRELLYAAVYKRTASKEKQPTPVIKQIQQKDLSSNNKTLIKQQKLFDFDDRCSTIQKQSEVFDRKSRLEIDEFFNPQKSIDFDEDEINDDSLFNLSSRLQSQASQVQRTRRICQPKKDNGKIKLVSREKQGYCQKFVYILDSHEKASVDKKITINYINLHSNEIKKPKIIDVKILCKKQSTCRSTSENSTRTTKKKNRSINKSETYDPRCPKKQNKIFFRSYKSQYV